MKNNMPRFPGWLQPLAAVVLVVISIVVGRLSGGSRRAGIQSQPVQPVGPAPAQNNPPEPAVAALPAAANSAVDVPAQQTHLSAATVPTAEGAVPQQALPNPVQAVDANSHDTTQSLRPVQLRAEPTSPSSQPQKRSRRRPGNGQIVAILSLLVALLALGNDIFMAWKGDAEQRSMLAALGDMLHGLDEGLRDIVDAVRDAVTVPESTPQSALPTAVPSITPETSAATGVAASGTTPGTRTDPPAQASITLPATAVISASSSVEPGPTLGETATVQTTLPVLAETTAAQGDDQSRPTDGSDDTEEEHDPTRTSEPWVGVTEQATVTPTHTQAERTTAVSTASPGTTPPDSTPTTVSTSTAQPTTSVPQEPSTTPANTTAAATATSPAVPTSTNSAATATATARSTSTIAVLASVTPSNSSVAASRTATATRTAVVPAPSTVVPTRQSATATATSGSSGPASNPTLTATASPLPTTVRPTATFSPTATRDNPTLTPTRTDIPNQPPPPLLCPAGTFEIARFAGILLPGQQNNHELHVPQRSRLLFLGQIKTSAAGSGWLDVSLRGVGGRLPVNPEPGQWTALEPWETNGALPAGNYPISLGSSSSLQPGGPLQYQIVVCAYQRS